jgi:hypothetical protein
LASCVLPSLASNGSFEYTRFPDVDLALPCLAFVVVFVLVTKLLLTELINNVDDISGFHGGEYEVCCLLGFAPCRANISTSETSVILYQISRRKNPADSHLQQ